MENKIIIYLEIPSIFSNYEVRVPVDLPIKDLMPLFVQLAVDLSAGLYVSSGRELLCANRQNILLNPNAALEDYGIGNGDHLTML